MMLITKANTNHTFQIENSEIWWNMEEFGEKRRKPSILFYSVVQSDAEQELLSSVLWSRAELSHCIQSSLYFLMQEAFCMQSERWSEHSHKLWLEKLLV